MRQQRHKSDGLHRTNWPDEQYFALVNCCAAINRRLSQTSARTIGHKEYAGRAQGKWDPGAIDMDILRADIQAGIGTGSGNAPTPRPPVPVGVYADVLLFRGSEGPQVAELQRQLGVTADGDFGPQTEGGGEGIPAAHTRPEGGRHRRACDRRRLATESIAAQRVTTDGG